MGTSGCVVEGLHPQATSWPSISQVNLGTSGCVVVRKIVHGLEAREGVVGPLAAGEIAACDEFLFWVVGDPAFSVAQKFVYFLGGGIVVLCAVEDRKEDIEVAKGVGEANIAGEGDVEVGRVTPAGRAERFGTGINVPTERREETLDEGRTTDLGFAARACSNGGEMNGEPKRGGGEFGA